MGVGVAVEIIFNYMLNSILQQPQDLGVRNGYRPI